MRFLLLEYNWVSRGQSAIIQGFQVTISWRSGGMLAASHAHWAGFTNAPSMVRDASHKYASPDSTMETDDWFWSGKLFVYPSLPVSAILVCWELFIRLTTMKIEPGWHVQAFHLVFVESFDERCYIPSIIYCINLSSRFYCAQHNPIWIYDPVFSMGTHDQIWW